MPSALDNGQRSPRKLLRAVIARLLGTGAEAGRMRRAAPSLLIVVALTACGGGQQRSTPPAPITRQALAAMVPRTANFPPEVRSLAPSAAVEAPSAAVRRGYVTNAKASAETPDPSDSGADLTRLGRTGGYHNLVATYTFVSTLAWAEASVDAFERDDEAQRFLDAQFAALGEQAGKENPTKGKIVDVEPASVPAGLGPATALRYTLVAGPDRTRVALVAFRVGRVVGWSNVARVDKLDPQPLADALAQTLRRQVELVVG